MIWLIHIAFIAANIWMARYHARLIKRDKKILHGLWALAYLIFTFGIASYFNWWFIAVGILMRALIFTNALNLYRGYAMTYNSKSTTSIIDKVERAIFRGNWFFETAVYLLLLGIAEYILITTT